jgi:serine/threonine protein kinase
VELEGCKVRTVLGRSETGTVYLAEQPDGSPRYVAVRVVGLAVDADRLVERLRALSARVAALNHPSVPGILAVWSTVQGVPLIAREYVAGPVVTGYFARTRAGVRDRLHLVATIAAAMGHAHARGLVHGHLVPANILVVRSTGGPVPRVVDLGVARLIQASVVHAVADVPADPAGDLDALGHLLTPPAPPASDRDPYVSLAHQIRDRVARGQYRTAGDLAEDLASRLGRA